MSAGNVIPLRPGPQPGQAINDAPPVTPVAFSPAGLKFLAYIRAIQAAMECGDMSEDEGLGRLLALQRALEASKRPRLVVDNTVRP